MRAIVTKTKISDGHYSYAYVAEAPQSGVVWVENYVSNPDEGIRKSLRRDYHFSEVIIIEEGFPA